MLATNEERGHELKETSERGIWKDLKGKKIKEKSLIQLQPEIKKSQKKNTKQLQSKQKAMGHSLFKG